MSISGLALNNISSLLKLNQLNKQEEMYIKDPVIKDKNELINNIDCIFHDLSRCAETMEYIYSNNFKIINEAQNLFSEGTKSQILYKFGINSPSFQKSKLLYQNLLTSIIDDGKEIENRKNIKEDAKMIVEDDDKNNLNENEIKEKISNINSICREMESALINYKNMKKEKEEKKIKKENEKNKMEIEKTKENTKDNKTEKKKERKRVLIDGVTMIFEDKDDCLDKLKLYKNSF